ncbi:hypothetical protein GCM10023188_25900 [Pontibacter saemangeumensis]|uniref:Uncharacterized protein n=1 Tax=Pontibacter saemangeumensis TaxID=1084525 RepID=A0ABP8LSZ1_9BACT
MTYGELEALLQAIAATVQRGTGHFHVGDGTSLALAVQGKGYPVIHVDPIAGKRSFERATKDARITIGFFEQGGPDLSAAQLQAIYSRQEAVSARFLFMLEEDGEIGNVSVSDSLVKNYTAELLTGIAVEFTLALPLSCS